MFSCGNVFIHFSTASLDSAHRCDFSLYRKTRCNVECLQRCAESHIRYQLLFILKVGRRRRPAAVSTVLRPDAAGLVYLCVLILLRRHSGCSDVRLNFNTTELHRLNRMSCWGWSYSRGAFKTPGRFGRRVQTVAVTQVRCSEEVGLDLVSAAGHMLGCFYKVCSHTAWKLQISLLDQVSTGGRATFVLLQPTHQPIRTQQEVMQVEV